MIEKRDTFIKKKIKPGLVGLVWESVGMTGL